MRKENIFEDMTDEELAGQVQAGSFACYEILVHRYSRRLYAFVFARIGFSQASEDIVQETFLKGFRNIRRYDQKYKFSTWLYTIALRQTISQYRKKRDVPPYEQGYNSEDPETVLIKGEQSDMIWRAVKKLKSDQQSAVWLRYKEDLSIREIAGVMKKTEVSVRTLLYRARQSLFREMEREDSNKSKNSGKERLNGQFLRESAK